MVSMKPKKVNRPTTFFAQENGGTALVPKKTPGDPVLQELKAQICAVEERLTAAKFANNILMYEESEWAKLNNDAQRKLKTCQEANRPAVERLIEITGNTVKKYQNRPPELPATIANLEDVLSKLNKAVKDIETDQQLKDVTSMFDIHTFEATKFDLASQSRDIKALLHTTDALLEITQ